MRRCVFSIICVVVIIAVVAIILLSAEKSGDEPKSIPGKSESGTETSVITKEPVADDTPLIDRFMVALERSIAEGRIEDTEYYTKNSFIEINKEEGVKSDLHVLMCTETWYRYHFVYYEDDVFMVPINVYDFAPEAVQYCDVDGNGKSEVIFYGSYGSGFIRQEVVYFDSNTKKFEDICRMSNHNVRVLEEIDDNGKTKHSIYAWPYRSSGNRKIYVGELVYKGGKFSIDLVREGDIVDVIEELVREMRNK